MAEAGSSDPRLVEQQVQKGAWELRKLGNEVRAAEVSAATPVLPELKPGKIDAPDGPSPIAVVGVYRALDQLARAVAGRCADLGLGKVRIVADDDRARQQRVHESVVSAIARLDADLDRAKPLLAAPAAGGVRLLLPIAPMVAASAVSATLPALLSLFETNTIVRSKEAEVSFVAASAAIAGALRAAGIETAVGVTGVPVAAQLTGRVRQLEEARDALSGALATFRLDTAALTSPATEEVGLLKAVIVEQAKKVAYDELTPLLERFGTEASTLSESMAAIAVREAKASAVQAVIDAVGAGLQALTTVAGDSTLLDIAESYTETVQFATLVVSPTYAGAESVYEEVPIRHDRGLHVGTAVLSFLLTTPEGALVDGGTLHRQVAGTSEMGRASVEWGS